MGVDDEYRAVAGNEDSAEHLLEKTGIVTRSTHKRRSMLASLAIGALIGAAATLLISIFFTPSAVLNKSAATSTSAADLSNGNAANLVSTISSITVPTPTAAVEESIHKGVSNGADSQEDLTITDCGNNPSEARAKNCIFDVMMQLWTPPACYDSNLSERYLAAGNWTWYADPEASRILSLDEMRLGEHDVIFVAQSYHKEHCIFAWEKVVRSLRNEGPLIEELISYDHVLHCKKRTLSQVDGSVRGVRAPTGFTRCGTYNAWKGHLPENKHSSID